MHFAEVVFTTLKPEVSTASARQVFPGMASEPRHRMEKAPPSQAEFCCAACGYTANADVNAAKRFFDVHCGI
jgi:hypothetical protein